MHELRYFQGVIMHELRYFQEIVSLSEDLETLWLEKCECVVNKKFRWLEALKIYYEGKEEWLFDYLPTRVQASQFIAESALPTFRVRFLNSCMRRGLR